MPAAALQEAWAAASQDDYPVLELLLDRPITVVDSLDAAAAEGAGVLAEDVHAAGSFDAGAAHAVLVARERGWPVVSADPAPLRAIDPGLPVEVLP